MTVRPTEVLLADAGGAPVDALLSWLSSARSPDTAFAPRDVDLFFVPPPSWHLGWIDEINAAFPKARPRCSLLLRGDQVALVSYALLRRLQNCNWKIVVCENTDHLIDLIDGADAGPSLADRVHAIELARKFRVEVDYALSLPMARNSPGDARRLLRFMAEHKVRVVSFARQLFLLHCGVSFSTAVPEASAADFYRSFLADWMQDRSVFHLEDIHVACDLVTGSSGAAERVPGQFFVTRDAVYQGAFVAVPQTKIADAPLIGRPGVAARVIAACRHDCEYFGVCGGLFLGERFLYDDSLASVRNPYCRSVFGTGVELMLQDVSRG